MHDPASIPELDRDGLRRFGFTMAAMIGLVFGIVLPWLMGRSWPLWPWLIAGVFAAWGLIAPQSLRTVYRGWMRVGLAIGKVTTPLLLGLVFFLIFTPVAAFMRLIGRDTLTRRTDAEAASYRRASDSRKRKHMERPF